MIGSKDGDIVVPSDTRIHYVEQCVQIFIQPKVIIENLLALWTIGMTNRVGGRAGHHDHVKSGALADFLLLESSRANVMSS